MPIGILRKMGRFALLCVSWVVIVGSFPWIQAQGPAAWRILDLSPIPGGRFAYTLAVSESQKEKAKTQGWRYWVFSRMAEDYGGALAQSMIFGDGERRFAVVWDLDASGALTASLLGNGGAMSVLTLADGAEAKSAYHLHELVYDPVSLKATYRVDSETIFEWDGQTGAF